ncbi:hypothetical protein GCM10022207_76610 [Streptomyces lannensis]|uniref:Uncharacterized protein n=1 Tax=Streptomyces lannensis TaxID=766498 RepID=A0ABP7LCE0_9ACTN
MIATEDHRRISAKSVVSGQDWARSVQALAQRTVREVEFTSRTGPPPAGMKAAVSPSPLDPVQRADPRKAHGTAPPVAGEERTDGRTATRR